MMVQKHRLPAYAMAVGLPLVVLSVIGVRLAGGSQPESPPEGARFRAAGRPSPPGSPARPDPTPLLPEDRPRSPAGPGARPSSWAGPPFQAPRHHRSGHYEIWDLSPEELAWIAEHAEDLFGTAIAAEPGGGVRLISLSTGAYVAERGFRPGDIIVDINGSPVYSPADLAGLLRGSARTGSRGWRVAVDRQGEAMTFDLRNLVGP